MELTLGNILPAYVTRPHAASNLTAWHRRLPSSTALLHFAPSVGVVEMTFDLPSILTLLLIKIPHSFWDYPPTQPQIT